MRKLILTCLSNLILLSVYSQNDTSAFHAVYVVPKADSNSSVYNGVEHLGYPSSIEGIPYYMTSDWHAGTLIYRDQPYADVYLKYDLVKDEVILRHFNGFTGVTLFTPRVHSFTLGNTRFVNLPGNNGKTPGIYEEMIQGEVSLYSKRSKVIEEKILTEGIHRKILSKNAYYLSKDGVLHPVRNEKGIMEILKDKKSEIRSHLKGKGLKYRKNPEAYLLTVVSYYNQLSR